MNHSRSPQMANITRTALFVEAALGLLAVGISWALGHRPFGALDLDARGELLIAALVGSLAALPPFLAMIITDHLPARLFRQFRALVHNQVAPLFQNTSVGQLLAISLAAGFGEELLFRGLIQGVLTSWIGPGVGTWVGLVIASVLFGLCHWLSATYAVMATLMGLLLGALFLLTGSLVAPIAMHAVYDFLALLYLVRCKRVISNQ